MTDEKRALLAAIVGQSKVLPAEKRDRYATDDEVKARLVPLAGEAGTRTSATKDVSDFSPALVRISRLTTLLTCFMVSRVDVLLHPLLAHVVRRSDAEGPQSCDGAVAGQDEH